MCSNTLRSSDENFEYDYIGAPTHPAWMWDIMGIGLEETGYDYEGLDGLDASIWSRPGGSVVLCSVSNFFLVNMDECRWVQDERSREEFTREAN